MLICFLCPLLATINLFSARSFGILCDTSDKVIYERHFFVFVKINDSTLENQNMEVLMKIVR